MLNVLYEEPEKEIREESKAYKGLLTIYHKHYFLVVCEIKEEAIRRFFHQKEFSFHEIDNGNAHENHWHWITREKAVQLCQKDDLKKFLECTDVVEGIKKRRK